MADNVNAPPPQDVPERPPPGQIVSEQALYLTQIALYRNTMAFGGQRNPSTIWNSMVRDDSPTILYYRELEEKDEDVSNALDGLKLSVLERDRSVTPADDSALALEISDFVQKQLDGLQNFHSVLDCMLDAPGYGFSVQEMSFDQSEGQVSLTRMDDCPQELFLFGPRYQPQIGQLTFLDSPYAATGTPVPETKFAIWSYRMRSRNRMGRPLLRSVFWPSWFKRNILRLWLQYAEKGPGTAVVRYMDGANASDRQNAAEIARALIEETALAVPDGFTYDVDLLKVARSQDPAVYKDAFQLMQYAIVRRIQGETLTSFGNEGGGGSKAQGETHAETKEQRTIELCRALGNVVNRQVVRPLVLWNYGPTAPMPTWSFDIEDEEDLTERIGIDDILKSMGLPFTENYLRDRYDVPAPGPNDAIIKPPPGPPPMNMVPSVKIRDVDSEQFSGVPASVEVEQSQYDELFDGLKAEAEGIYKKRVHEIVDAVKAGLGR